MSLHAKQITDLVETAKALAADGDVARAAEVFAVAADAAEEFGSSFWGRDLRNEARRHAGTAWLRAEGHRVHVDDLHPYAVKEAGRPLRILGTSYGAAGAFGEVHHWWIVLPSVRPPGYEERYLHVDNQGRVSWTARPRSRR